MKGRRICMVRHGPYPVGQPRTARESAAAISAGWEVDVVAMKRRGDSLIDTVDGVRVIRIPVRHVRGRRGIRFTTEYVLFTVLATLVVAVLHIRRRYAVVQIHNPPDFLLVTALVPRLLGARTLFDIHDLASDMFLMRFEGSRQAPQIDRALRALERYCCRVADVVLTVHEPYRRELSARGVDGTKVEVVMNSVDESLLPSEAPAGRKDAFRIVFHGTVTPHYGLDLLVEAVAELRRHEPSALLEIYGEGDAVATIDRRAAELGIHDRLVLSRECLPHREVLALVQGASVAVLPNLPLRLNRFALSAKLFEYVALRIPVVASDLETIREHFSESEILFFRAGDVASLAQALTLVARDPESSRRRAAAASLRYESYRWPAQARRYVDLLERLAEGTWVPRPTADVREGCFD